MKGGMKWDQGKPMMSLGPPGTARRIGVVMTQVVRREVSPYEINSWRNVRPPAKYLDALERHLEAFKEGEDLDPGTKQPHLWHVLANAAILSWFRDRGDDLLYPLHIPVSST